MEGKYLNELVSKLLESKEKKLIWHESEKGVQGIITFKDIIELFIRRPL